MSWSQVSWIAVTGLLAPGLAVAQDRTATTPLEDVEVVSLAEWSYDELYAEGWRGQTLLDAEVEGPDGEEIGDVENLIIGPDGRIRAVIAEVGGFWDIGDTHVSVPWDEVEIDRDLDAIRVPVTEDRVGEYSVFRDYMTVEGAETTVQPVDDNVETGPRAWKLTNLIGDYALLEDRAGYGYVDDVIFNRDGEIKSVVVTRDIGYGAPGYYGYPYHGYGYGWDPGYDYYSLPYGRDEIADMEPFDYDRLEAREEG